MQDEKESEIVVIDLITNSCDSVSEEAKKHRNSLGSVDHTYRVDVIGKTLMRQLFNTLISWFSEVLKGRKKPSRFFPHLLDTLTSQYPICCEDRDFLHWIIAIVSKKILKAKFQANLNAYSPFSSEEKADIISKGLSYKSLFKKFSWATERRSNLNHPFIRLAKNIVNKNEIYSKKFWRRIIESRKKEIQDLDKYRKLISNKLGEIDDL